MIKYLKTFGFKINREAFERNSWYLKISQYRKTNHGIPAEKGIYPKSRR